MLDSYRIVLFDGYLIGAQCPALERLHGGITVDGLPAWSGGRSQTLQFIDWEQPQRNEFTVIKQEPIVSMK